MKIVQTKLLLLASALFVATSCDCMKKQVKEEKVEVQEQVANESESTLVADASEAMENPAVEVAPVSEESKPEVAQVPADMAQAPAADMTSQPAETTVPAEASADFAK